MNRVFAELTDGHRATGMSFVCLDDAIEIAARARASSEKNHIAREMRTPLTSLLHGIVSSSSIEIPSWSLLNAEYEKIEYAIDDEEAGVGELHDSKFDGAIGIEPDLDDCSTDSGPPYGDMVAVEKRQQQLDPNHNDQWDFVVPKESVDDSAVYVQLFRLLTHLNLKLLEHCVVECIVALASNGLVIDASAPLPLTAEHVATITKLRLSELNKVHQAMLEAKKALQETPCSTLQTVLDVSKPKGCCANCVSQVIRSIDEQFFQIWKKPFTSPDLSYLDEAPPVSKVMWYARKALKERSKGCTRSEQGHEHAMQCLLGDALLASPYLWVPRKR